MAKANNNASRKLLIPGISGRANAKPSDYQGGYAPQRRQNIPTKAALSQAAPIIIASMKPEMKHVHNMPIPGMGNITYGDALTFANNVKKAVPKIKEFYQEFGAPVFKGVPAGPSPKGGADYVLSPAPEPKAVSLRTPVSPNVFSTSQMAPVQDLCSPMHVTCVTFQFPTFANSSLLDYFNKNIAFDLQTRAQANVGFDLNVSTNFSATQIITAFNAAITGLQVYYWFASIMSHEAETKNKNDAMSVLRTGITAQIYSDVVQLGRRLEDTPLPPRIVEWVRYMSSNFYSGNTQGSPLIKICPNPTYLRGTGSVSAAANALTAMNTTSNGTIYSLLRRAVPQWRIGKLYDVPTTPCYDKQFCTIFANLPATDWNGTAAFNYPNAAATSTEINYNSYSNRLDGAAYAMGGVSVGGNMLPGLVSTDSIQASASLLNNRLSYYINVGTPLWAFAREFNFIARSRQESYQFSDAYSIYTPHLIGTDKCREVNANTLTQTAKNVMDFLVNIDGIPNKGPQISNFNRRANGQI